MSALPEQGQRSDAVRNRAKLLVVARRALVDDESLTMNELARLAGVGVGTAYRHFPSREALLETLLVEPFQQLLEAAQQAEQDDDAWAGIERILRLAFELELGEPGFATVFSAVDDARRETVELKVTIGAIVEGLLDRARLQGTIRSDVGADDLRRLVCGMDYAVRSGIDDDRSTAERYFQILLSGLRQSST